MTYLFRIMDNAVHHFLSQGKSILLLGPNHTGKHSFIEQQIHPPIHFTFAEPAMRQCYEKHPAWLNQELMAQIKAHPPKPVVWIEEIQKIPGIMAMLQPLIDHQVAQFIFTGASSRKLLRGRMAELTMTPLLYSEWPEPKPTLDELLVYGSLPTVVNEKKSPARETLLQAYATQYLEEDIRAENVVRHIGKFARFIELAAGEAGKQLNFSRLAQEIDVSITTISTYYQILEESLMVLRINPIVDLQSKRRLIKSPKYLFFDLGMRRAFAKEGASLPQSVMMDLFVQYVGMELYYQGQWHQPGVKIKYWRDSAGPEVNYVIEMGDLFIPVEVKWSEKPTLSDAKYLIKFMDEYKKAPHGFIVARTAKRYQLSPQIDVIPWQDISSILP